MHYKNGREAKNGDRIFKLGDFYPPVAGILYDAEAGNNDCNGKIAIPSLTDHVADLKNCLHADDIAKATIPDSTKPATSDIATPGPVNLSAPEDNGASAEKL